MNAEEKPRGVPERNDAPAARDDVKVSASFVRCPYCHAEVSRETEEWVACVACLARHHAACWRESGKCATCGHGANLAAPPVARPQGARLAPIVVTVAALLFSAAIASGLVTYASWRRARAEAERRYAEELRLREEQRLRAEAERRREEEARRLAEGQLGAYAPEALEHYRKGMDHLAKGENALASDELWYALKLDERFGEAVTQRVVALERDGQVEKAIEALEKALIASPNARQAAEWRTTLERLAK